MQDGPGERSTGVLDLGELPLEEILEGHGSALSQALQRVLRHLAGDESPVAAYDSGGDFLASSRGGEDA